MRDEAIRRAHERITEESARVASGEVSHVDLVGCAVDAAREVYARELRARSEHSKTKASCAAVVIQTTVHRAHGDAYAWAADLLTQGDEHGV